MTWYFDAEAGEEVKPWERQNAPVSIRLRVSSQEFALHLSSEEALVVGGTAHYFDVRDADRQRRRIVDLPWMRLFSVTDPDGHVLRIQTPVPDWSKGD